MGIGTCLDQSLADACSEALEPGEEHLQVAELLLHPGSTETTNAGSWVLSRTRSCLSQGQELGITNANGLLGPQGPTPPLAYLLCKVSI